MIPSVFNAHVLEVTQATELREVLGRVGVQAKGREVLERKGLFRAVKLQGVGYREALIAKQEMLGAGGDAATPKGTVEFSADEAELVLLGTPLHYRRFVAKMKRQPFRCGPLAEEVEGALAGYERRGYALPLAGGRLDLDRTRVMGVLNVTPDSFSDGGEYLDPARAVARAEEMAAQGAAVVDVGAESTRPGSGGVSEGEEWKRLDPVLKEIVDRLDVPVSVDTSKPEIADRALDRGVSLINDVTGLRDEAMIQVVARHDVPVVVMHMQGTPQTMQEAPAYDDVVADVVRWLRGRLRAAEDGGVDAEKLVVDPGIGFGKTPEHNLRLLRHLGSLRSLGRPILVGASRKSFISQVTGVAPEERLEGSLAAAVLAAARGAHLVRVHDVAATVRALALADAVLGRAAEP